MKKAIGLFLFISFLVIPIVIWCLMKSLNDRFGSLPIFFASLGQLTGLAGTALFALTLILSARFKFLEKYLNAQNRIYINHHKIGTFAFVFLLLHPLALAGRYLPLSVKLTASFLLDFSNWASIFGKIALLLLMALLVITFYLRLGYKNWKATHQWLILAFFLGSLHMFFVSSDVSQNLFLRGYMIFLASAGLFAYFYRKVINPQTLG